MRSGWGMAWGPDPKARTNQPDVNLTDLPTTNDPFIWFDDARGSPAGDSILLSGLQDIYRADRPDQLAGVLHAIDAAHAGGALLAGFVSYEAGYLLEPRLIPHYRAPPAGQPLVWFGTFRDARTIAPIVAEQLFATAERGQHSARLAAARPDIQQADFEAQVAGLLGLINAGDIYQANLTLQAQLSAGGCLSLPSLKTLYARIRRAQRARYGVYAQLPGLQLLSFSPELFCSCDGSGQIAAQPMKGTAPRAPEAGEDQRQAQVLAADPKNRAENLMITDLLRNDLSRIAVPGSVQVSALFEVQALPTLHQMTSTITAQTRTGMSATETLLALFPCGSITGAPKIRAMEVLRACEDGPRGIYTGAIGYIRPDGASQFNVAIRTLVQTDADGGGPRIGLGSGIVADSDPAGEWHECLAKAAFLNAECPPFDLIETLGWHPGEGLRFLSLHMDRLGSAAHYHGFAVDVARWTDALERAVAPLAVASRVRLLVSRFGACCVQVAPLTALPGGLPVALSLWPHPVDPASPWLYTKTSHRAWYDEARQQMARSQGSGETLFVNVRGELTEGSFTNLFVKRGATLLTPPLRCGLLPGVLRAHLLDTGQAREQTLALHDLQADDELLIGNALRGLMPARLIEAP